MDLEAAADKHLWFTYLTFSDRRCIIGVHSGLFCWENKQQTSTLVRIDLLSVGGFVFTVMVHCAQENDAVCASLS